MAGLEFIGELFAEIVLEGIIFRVPVKIYEWITGKDTGNGYRTEYKKFVKFSGANKFLLTWETDLEHLKHKLTEGLRTTNQELKFTDFLFTTIDQRTLIQPPTSISFYDFHFLVQWLTEYGIKAVGIVETTRTVYTTYNDPDSENLIGQTDKGKRFFISLMEDYSKRQFLRVNRDIKTVDEYNVLTIKSGLAHSR